MKVEVVAVLGSPSLTVLMVVSVDVKHHVYLLTIPPRVPGEIKRS